MPGRLVNRASDGYRGEGKTDARDAYVIADQARMRRDLRPIRPGDEAAIELKLLTGRRADLVEDRTRSVNRLRGTLLSMFPALERALDVTNTGPLKLLTGFQTPAAIRRAGVTRLTKWLANRKARGQSPGRGGGRGRRAPAHRCLRGEDHRQAGPHPGRGGDGPQRADRRDGQAHRGPISRARTRGVSRRSGPSGGSHGPGTSGPTE